MGSTYANAVVVGATRDDVVEALGATAAFVAPADGGAVAVFSREDEEALGMAATARQLSSALGQPVLDTMVFDSDVCVLRVVVGGEPVAQFVAPPGAMEAYDEEPGEVDPAGFAARAVQVLGRGDPSALAAALAADRVFAEEAHAEALAALGLPAWAAGLGYRYLEVDAPDLPCGPLVHIT